MISSGSCKLCEGLVINIWGPIPTQQSGISICQNCYDGAKSLFAALQKFKPRHLKPTTKRHKPYQPPKPAGAFADALKCLKAIEESMEEHLKEQLSYVGEYFSAYRSQISYDVQLKPGDDGPSIPAHRAALLATRSDIFINMLDSDGCKASVPSETITFHEMSYIELESLLEFLYYGKLPKEKAEKNVYALTRAAHKYELPFLQKYCERQMRISLSTSNVLDVLEISDTYCKQNLKETAVNFIAEHAEEIVFSDRYEAFMLKNPQLSLQIMRTSTRRKYTPNACPIGRDWSNGKTSVPAPNSLFNPQPCKEQESESINSPGVL